MNFLQNIFNNPQTSFDPLNFLGILATVLASLYIFKSETSISLIKERHEKLLFPLFDVLEPILFQEPDKKQLNDALKIIENNKHLADGKLLELYYYCSQNLTKNNFISLCTYVDKAYDHSCRKLKLKTRSMNYRINRHQYKSRLYLVFYLILHISLITVTLMSVIFVFAFIFALIDTLYTSATMDAKLIYLSLLCIFAVAAEKFISKHF